uniref:NADH-ubiquinone oxidoreductase chain 4 n=1 Tax=Thuricola similis TaxID=2784598 RepID=A0A7T8G586_9CILI|nr:NADH dehydrogenase subunit 4 [Thuricola similis]QQP22131.1 NADH dehydrogenase subunit 4 [Thuricola similis]
MLVNFSLININIFLNYTPIFTIITFFVSFTLILSSKILYLKKDYYISLVKFIIYLLLNINFIFIVLKFLIQILYLHTDIASLNFLQINFLNTNIIFQWNFLGTSLLLLCYITSIICLFYLGDRNLFANNISVFFFFMFLVCTTFLVTTTNLLIMFFCFECIFLPSMYFVFKLGYVKKVDKTIYFLLIWTLFGSLLVLFILAYILSIAGSLNFIVLANTKFSLVERIWIYFGLFVGYGIKIPLFPFHYWLTKVHVEAPAGFSIFLSGFLVKTAAYCFYYIHLIFSNETLKLILILWIIIGIVESSLKMWSQLDIKKLIAFATIQEMNMIMLCLILFNQININITSIFFLLHGLLSTYMFLLVDQIQKRTQTRNILELSGVGLIYPFLRNFIWFLLILFLGFPGTTKFIIEWHVGFLLITLLHWVGFFVFIVALVAGGIGFTKCWFLILYGTRSTQQPIKHFTVDLFRKDQLIFYTLIFLMTFLMSLILLIIEYKN